jgi:hypothetical protein
MPRTYSWRPLCAQLAALVAVFVIANIITYRTSGYFQKESEYHKAVDGAAERRGVRIIFAGDSHVAHPLNDYFNENPAAIAYSLAVGGDSPRECFAKIRYVLNAGAAIDTLIISVDPHMFGRGRLESSNRSFADWYFIVAGDGSGLGHGWLSALLDQVPLFNNDFVQYLRKAVAARFSHGAAASATDDVEGTWSTLSDVARAAEARSTGKMDHVGVGQYAQPFRWYARILAVARSHNVRVIGVRFPVHPEYSAQAPPAKVALIDDFLRRHGITEIIDLRDLVTDPAEFDDPDHVNGQGTAVMVRELEERLHRPLARQPAQPVTAATRP